MKKYLIILTFLVLTFIVPYILVCGCWLLQAFYYWNWDYWPHMGDWGNDSRLLYILFVMVCFSLAGSALIEFITDIKKEKIA